MNRIPLFFLLINLLWPSLLCGQPRFEARTIVSGLQYGYQLSAVDLTGDGRKDLIAVDERAEELAWFENPGWERRVMARQTPRPINVDCWDYDGDGTPECLLGYNFGTDPRKSIGNLVLLDAGTDVREPWRQKEIDRIPTLHRLRWIDPEGKEKKILLAAPMVGANGVAPNYVDAVPIYGFSPEEWKRERLSHDRQGILHAIQPVRWSGKAEAILTADFQGLHLYQADKQGRWTGTLLAAGDPRPCPQCGSSEGRAGRLGKGRFLAAIEPWHGNQVVVYRQEKKQWLRTVLEEGMQNGHALETGDLDGDGRDEIVAGSRGKGYQLFLFRTEDTKGLHWQKIVLDDGGIAAADCKIADFTGDGRPDIACIGASTGNIRLYVNLR